MGIIKNFISKMSKSQKKDKKMVKRAIRDSLVGVEEEQESVLQYEGGDDVLTSRESCVMFTSKMSTDMAKLVIVLNVLFAPIGTLLAAGLDKRGFNMKLLTVGIIYLIPFIIIQILAAQAQSKWGPEAEIANKETDDAKKAAAIEAIAKEAANLIVGVICLALVNFVLWIHGICLSCHILTTNKLREAFAKGEIGF